MNNNDKYRGIFPAFYACYDDNGDISPERTRQLALMLMNKGVKGLYVGGSSGECIYQSVDERKLVLESVMEVVKGKLTIIAHIAAPNTKDSIELAQHAEKVGVDALSAIPPIYYSFQEKAIGSYWTDIIGSNNLDFIIYNIPQTTGYNLSMALFNEMIENPKVIGIKNTSMPVLDIQQFKVAGGKDFIIFNGPDEQFVGGRIMGADSGIGGTYGVMPELFIKADEFVKTGCFEEARQIQNAINDIIMDLQSFNGSMFSVIKEVLRLQGINIGYARLPLAPLEDFEYTRVKKVSNKIEKYIKEFC